MKYIITIEEMVSQDFTVDAANMEEAVELAEYKYNNGEFVLSPGNLMTKRMSGQCLDINETTDRTEF